MCSCKTAPRLGLIVLYLGASLVNSCCVNITIAVLSEYSEVRDFPTQINRTVGIIEKALNKTREILEPVANVDFIIYNLNYPSCTSLHWGALTAKLYFYENIHAIVGPGCSNGIETISRMAVSFDLPHITYAGTSESLTNKKEFSRLSRISYTMDNFANFYMDVLSAFNWVDIANIHDTVSFSPNLVGNSLQTTFLQHGVLSYKLPFSSATGDLTAELLRVLNEAKKISRDHQHAADAVKQSKTFQEYRVSAYSKSLGAVEAAVVNTYFAAKKDMASCLVPELNQLCIDQGLKNEFETAVVNEPSVFEPQKFYCIYILGVFTEKPHSKPMKVFLVACHADIFREMVLLARGLGMPQGEYVFIYFTNMPGDRLLGDYSWKRGDELDLEAKIAYDSVMVVRPRRPTSEEYLAFEKYVMQRAYEEHGYVWHAGHQGAELNIFNVGQYDSFMLLAYALNDTLTAGEDPRDGEQMIKRMWNRTFPGIGGMVYMNENGDRDTDFTLIDVDPITGDWRPVAQYLGYTRTFELIPDVAIHWPNDFGPPPNRPPCGYVGELCRSFSLPTYASVAIALGSVIVVVVVAGAIIYRRMKAEADILSQWWKVKWEDITIQKKSSFFSSCSGLGDDKSMSVATHTRAQQSIGVYKGTQVHIQKLKLKSLTVDRKMLMELKQMRDVTCPNLTRLIGVCPDTNNVAILTEQCSRGNLQDILQNESIQLDWDFRISLVNDIVQGMYYIHYSPIEVHGRLTSSRCVIDSRFVLKITGFGLPSILDCHASLKNKHDLNHYVVNSELLWMAPEILRNYPPRKASQPGDVYSFAIILYEMCTRNEPYVTESWYQSLEDTLADIKREKHSGRRPSFRDSNSFPELVKLAQSCWKERPEERPTFGSIRKTVMSLRRGINHGKNVLDVLLNRMEQYANNLEGLVEERTCAFLEEKKKSEELLYQVLPKSVADQLRSGQTVIPEAYESVSIYFSDIVGFTTISAASTPFQVVDFLNDVYTCFDKIIENFEVYKVETIGDAYMVVSGLPVRNGKEHVRQIVRMSLSILEQVQQFTIRHQPETPLRARIGIHSGPVCAGVVGRKMPRYCLFGDTVNTASRMESNGEAMKIHISESTKHLLDAFGNFMTEERGVIDVKGKGLMSTHWLIDEFPSSS